MDEEAPLSLESSFQGLSLEGNDHSNLPQDPSIMNEYIRKLNEFNLFQNRLTQNNIYRNSSREDKIPRHLIPEPYIFAHSKDHFQNENIQIANSYHRSINELLPTLSRLFLFEISKKYRDEVFDY